MKKDQTDQENCSSCNGGFSSSGVNGLSAEN